MLKHLYEKDFQLWIQQTIEQLQQQNFTALDVEHLIEELTELGKSEKNRLESNLMVLLAHLLKLMVQQDAPEMMKASWYNSVDEHRQRVQKQLQQTPSLKSFFTTAIQNAYIDSRRLAIKEGKRAQFGVRIPHEEEYPKVCPFSIEQILDEDFYG
ncbi:DUF29 domain-containing protein [Planktothrix mougeotii]|uniref:DUF29 domain-containing protein n=1 Tax=Planktothrix mougeotii LEGE 06226 TaxID=1828728 RepID=A0ABR9UE92_9CYAN|nr:DUF29 domain-containing protein [Planktothrix mougeotii]MBE9144787.1 DUF29 domain-containing protein [Planktothrix mougeotii LEGE 06226]